jgi:hypothetical protein
MATLDLRKVPAASVPLGESISLNGKIVWAAYHKPDGALVAIAATADEARRKYFTWWSETFMSGTRCAEGNGHQKC